MDDANNEQNFPNGRRAFLGRIREYSAKLAAVGVGLTAYNGGRVGRNREIADQLPAELTKTNRLAVKKQLDKSWNESGSNEMLTSAVAAASAAGYAAAVVQERTERAQADDPAQPISRREMLLRSGEVTGAAVIAGGVSGALHAAGGGRELNEIADTLPNTLSDAERRAVNQAIYLAGDKNEERLQTGENVLKGGVTGFAATHLVRRLLRRTLPENDGQSR